MAAWQERGWQEGGDGGGWGDGGEEEGEDKGAAADPDGRFLPSKRLGHNMRS